MEFYDDGWGGCCNVKVLSAIKTAPYSREVLAQVTATGFLLLAYCGAVSLQVSGTTGKVKEGANTKGASESEAHLLGGAKEPAATYFYCPSVIQQSFTLLTINTLCACSSTTIHYSQHGYQQRKLPVLLLLQAEIRPERRH